VSEARPQKSSATAWMLFILAALLLYWLSIGPVFYLEAIGRVPGSWEPWLNDFYRPLDWLHDHTPMWAPMNAYGRWWLKLAIKNGGFPLPPLG
jgi:hypothetical protein